MDDIKIMETCFSCGNQFQMGPHVYGEFISRYQFSVCQTCFNGNWDGWAPHVEEKLVRHLEEKGLPIPNRNEKGRMPRGK